MSKEIAAYLLNAEAVYLSGASLVFDEKKCASLDVPGTHVNVALKNAEHFSDAEKRILSFLAVLGLRFTQEWIDVFLPAYAGNLSSDISPLLDNACALGFIEKNNGGYRWPHAGVRDYFYQAVDVRTRKSLHLDIARFLEARIAVSPELLFEAAYHFMKSGDSGTAVPYAFAAGRRAMAVYAYESAFDFFTYCICSRSGMPDSDSITFLSSVYIGVIAVNRGHYAEAVSQLRSLVRGSPQAFLPELYRHLSFAYYKLGDFSTCEDISRKGLALLGENIPRRGFPLAFGIVRQCVRLCAAAVLPPKKNPPETKKKHQERIFFWGTLVRGYSVSNIMMLMYSALRVRTIVSRNLRGTADQATADLTLAGT
ncbi:MAG: hypothetical protein ACRCUT_11335, partial [Spirochaetota bacterium]